MRQDEPATISITAQRDVGEDPLAVTAELYDLLRETLYQTTSRRRHDLAPPVEEDMAPLFADDKA